MNKSKLSVIHDEDPLSLADQITNHHFFEWVTKNGVNLLFGVMLLFSLLFFLYRMSASDRIKAENDYLLAAKEYTTFLSLDGKATTPLAREEAFKGLEAIVERRPDMAAKYDALIAQALIARQEVDRALPFAKRTFQRTRGDHLPLYRDFAEATLLLSQNKGDEALAKSRDLAASIVEKGEKEEMAILYTYNLLREAMLQQSAGNREAELQAWQKLDNSLYTTDAMLSNKGNELRAIFESLFSEGNVSLKNYIDYREKALQKG